MIDKNIRNKIDSIIYEKINEAILYNKIHNIVFEEISKCKKTLISEDSESDTKRKSVMKMLKDNKYNHAELMRKLYHPKDKKEEDTYRSLFSKKFSGKPDYNGVVRQFDDDEIKKLYNILNK